MLNISPAKVAEVIILAREMRDPTMPRGEAEFEGLIGDMNDDERAALVAVFWIGRGTFDAAELDDAVRIATNEATTPTATYLNGSPHLADHLEAGLEALDIRASDAEEDLYRPT